MRDSFLNLEKQGNSTILSWHVWPLMLALLLFVAADLRAQSRTWWQMHEGKGIQDLTTPVPTGKHGDPDTAYALADIPASDDAGWTTAPNKETINFSRSSTVKCYQQVDYTYFQTFVTVPDGVSMEKFTILFKGMDDGSRITIFNTKYPNGTVDPGSYVELGGSATADLVKYLAPGENRVVITQVDDCASANHLEYAEVSLNGNLVVAKREPMACNNSFGDVHIRTPDGLVYDYQAAGEFVLVRSKAGNGTIIQARQEKWETNPRVTVNKAVAMQVVGDKVGIYTGKSPSLYINGQATSLSPGGEQSLPKGGSVFRSTGGGEQYTVEWPDGFQACATVRSSHLDIGVRRGDPQLAYEGLLGNLNGESGDDLLVRNGPTLEPPAGLRQLYEKIGPSWCVSPQDSLFSQGSVVPCNYPSSPISVADLTPQQMNDARGPCEGIEDQFLQRSCLLDVGVTGDPSFAESAKAAQTAWPAQVARGDSLGVSVLAADPYWVEEGEPLRSFDKGYTLVLQSGYLVLRSGDRVVWRSSGRVHRARAFGLTEEGDFCIMNEDGPAWCVGTNRAALLTVENGRLGLRDRQEKPLWRTCGGM